MFQCLTGGASVLRQCQTVCASLDSSDDVWHLRVPTNVYIIYMLYMRQCQRWELLHVSTTKQREQSCPSLTSTRQQTGLCDHWTLHMGHSTMHMGPLCATRQNVSTLLHYIGNHFQEMLSGWSVTVPLHNEQCSLNIPNCTLMVPTAVQRNCNASLILKSSTETPLFWNQAGKIQVQVSERCKLVETQRAIVQPETL